MFEFTWPSFSFAVVNFLILAWLLTKFLHRPLLGVLSAREQKLADTRKAAEEEKAQAEQLRVEYEGKVAAAAEERDRVLIEARSAAEDAGRAVVEKATAEAKAEVEKLREAYGQERREAMKDVQEELVDVSVKIAHGILKKLTGAELDAKLHARLLAELEALDPGAGQVQTSLPVRVSSACPLDDAVRQDIETRVRAHAGDGAEIVFATDPSLVAGTRVEFSSLAVEASLSDVLARVREQALAPPPAPAEAVTAERGA